MAVGDIGNVNGVDVTGGGAADAIGDGGNDGLFDKFYICVIDGESNLFDCLSNDDLFVCDVFFFYFF